MVFLGLLKFYATRNIADIYHKNDFVAGFDIALQDFEVIFLFQQLVKNKEECKLKLVNISQLRMLSIPI